MVDAQPGVMAYAPPVGARDGRGPSVDGLPLIELRNIGKRFPGVVALDGVSFEIGAGEVLALVGENGAGKSTIIKILSGVQRPDQGQILVRGEPVTVTSTRQAQQLGIQTIYQEHTLAPDLNGVQNIFFGNELRKRLFGFGTVLDDRAMRERAFELYAEFEANADGLDRPTGEAGALRQRVIEIVKAFAFEADLVIMDEPTAALPDHERETLFEHIRRLKARGVAVLLVTHRLGELFGLVDRIVVLRDGRLVGEADPKHASVDAIVRMMVGREIKDIGEAAALARERDTSPSTSHEMLRVEGLCAGVLRDIDITVNKGEVLGLAGLAGAGRTELARAILGADRLERGTIYLEGRPVSIRSPKDALGLGIALVPEERKTAGIFADFSIARNITASALSKVLFGRSVINERRERAIAWRYVDELGVRPHDISRKICVLSGGNQQKVLVARALFATAKVIIFDEPTQGIDVGAKVEIYRLIEEYVAGGGAVIAISSELPELLGLCDRIVILHEGRKAGEISAHPRATTSSERIAREEKLMSLATGAEKE